MLNLHIGYYIDRLLYYKSTLDPNSDEYENVVKALRHATKSLLYYEQTNHHRNEPDSITLIDANHAIRR